MIDCFVVKIIIHDKRCIVNINYTKKGVQSIQKYSRIFVHITSRLYTKKGVSFNQGQGQQTYKTTTKFQKEVRIMCMKKSELENKVNELRSLKALKEETENELKALEREIIDYMTENELTEEITDTSKITYKPQSRTTLDKEKLTEILGEDLKPFEKTTFYNVLRIK